MRTIWLLLCYAATGPIAGADIRPERPNVMVFPAERARFVRIVVHQSSASQPCIDELEVYGPASLAAGGTDGRRNLALATGGGKASASSCLAGYAIHRIEHLNDGNYGNSHSWIAAGTTGQWAQIELPAATAVSKVVFSRDRDGRYRDRVPIHCEVRISLDEKQWKSVCTVRAEARIATATASLAAGGTEWSDFVIPTPSAVGPLDTSQTAVSEALQSGDPVRYAFLCEARTAAKIDRSDPSDRVLKQFSEMIERLAAEGLDVSQQRREFAELSRRRKALAANSRWGGSSTATPTAAEATLFFEARMAKRRLFLCAPDLEKIEKVLFVKRHPFLPSHNYSVIFDAQGAGGGAVCAVETPWRDGRLWPEEARVVRLFECGEGIARDPTVDFAAEKIYFGYRTSKADYFHVMAMDVTGSHSDGSGARRLTDGPFHDYYPCPLPDGGISFISTRCKARYLCWRPQAFVLFRMQPDGSDIRPLSHANISEWTPAVMRDGRIIWMRSEYLDKGANFGHTLWAIRPDGTRPALVFGNNTRNCYANGREVPGTSEICCTLVSHGGDLNGPIALIDLSKGRFNPAAVRKITPDVPAQYHMSWIRKECFRDPVPIGRDYFLCSHAPDDRFGLYVIDRYGNRELLYMDAEIGSMCPVPLRPTPVPPVLQSAPPQEPAGDEVTGGDNDLGQFAVSDVYQGLPAAIPRGAVKYLRVCGEVRSDLARLPNGEYRADHEPFQDWYATPIHKVSGPHGWPSYVAKETFGLAKVEEDGSANFYAPAGKVLYFQALDEKFNELQRMRSVVQLQPGERRSCIGCHEDRSSAPPVRQAVALRRRPQRLEPPPWGTGPLAYEKVVQPVWDAKCVSCHDDKDQQQINLVGVADAERVPASYRTLVEQGWVHYFDYRYNVPHTKAGAGSFGTLNSKLWKVLDAGHYDVELSEEQMRAVKCWIDMNCPLWPDYQFRVDRPAATVATAG